MHNFLKIKIMKSCDIISYNVVSYPEQCSGLLPCDLDHLNRGAHQPLSLLPPHSYSSAGPRRRHHRLLLLLRDDDDTWGKSRGPRRHSSVGGEWLTSLSSLLLDTTLYGSYVLFWFWLRKECLSCLLAAMMVLESRKRLSIGARFKPPMRMVVFEKDPFVTQWESSSPLL